MGSILAIAEIGPRGDICDRKELARVTTDERLWWRPGTVVIVKAESDFTLPSAVADAMPPGQNANTPVATSREWRRFTELAVAQLARLCQPLLARLGGACSQSGWHASPPASTVAQPRFVSCCAGKCNWQTPVACKPASRQNGISLPSKSNKLPLSDTFNPSITSSNCSAARSGSNSRPSRTLL